jgi:hypothetical protein
MSMNRRKFLRKVTAATAAIGFISAGTGEAIAGNLPEDIKVNELPQLGSTVKQQFDEIFRWLKKHGWLQWLYEETGITGVSSCAVR